MLNNNLDSYFHYRSRRVGYISLMITAPLTVFGYFMKDETIGIIILSIALGIFMIPLCIVGISNLVIKIRVKKGVTGQIEVRVNECKRICYVQGYRQKFKSDYVGIKIKTENHGILYCIDYKLANVLFEKCLEINEFKVEIYNNTKIIKALKD